jgi:hypothetical protein
VIRSGQKRRLGTDFVTSALQLSVLLQINELEAVDLLTRAQQLQPRFPGVPALTIAENQFYDQRETLLKTLLHLFSYRAVNLKSGSPAAAFILPFANSLLSDEHFFEYLLNAARQRVEQTQGDATKATQYLRAELRLLCQIIFCLSYSCSNQIKDTDAKGLLDLLRYSSDRLAAMQTQPSTPTTRPLPVLIPSAPLSEPQSSLVFNTALLTVSMAAYIDPLATFTLQAAQEPSPSPPQAYLAKFLGKDGHFQRDVVNNGLKWQHTAIRGVLLLAASLSSVHQPSGQELLSESQESACVNEAIQCGAFSCLEHLSTALMHGFENPQTYLSTIEEIFVAFLQGMPQFARDLKQEEEESLRKVQIWKNYPYGQQPPEPSRHFEQLLSAIAHVYECVVDSPSEISNWQSLTARFWDGSLHPELNQFLRSCGDNIFQDIFVPFLRFLRVVSGGAFQSTKTHEFLCERRPYVNWQSFFTVLRNTALAFQENGSSGTTTGPSGSSAAAAVTLRPEDLHGMTAMVKLIATVVHFNETARTFLMNSGLNPLETLFGLLACPVPPELKSAVMDAIRAFSEVSELSPRIWQLMSSIQLLPSGGGGIRAELADIEASNERYPSTISFLKLIHRLVCTATASDSNTPGPQELWQYLTFVEKDVLSSMETRIYKVSHEKSDLTLYSLYFLCRLVQAAQTSFFLQHQFHDTLAAAFAPRQADPSNAHDKSSLSALQESIIQRLSCESPTVLVGLRLISSMLVPGNLITRKLLDLVSIGVESLIEERDKPRGATVESSVLASLTILHCVMQNQSLFLSNYDLFASAWTRAVSPATKSAASDSSSVKNWQSDLAAAAFRAAQELGTAPLEPLDRQMLSQPEKLVAAIRFVEYPYNELVNRLAVKITEHLCSKGEFSAAVIRLLFDKQQQPHIVAAYSLLLELPDGSYPLVPLEEGDVGFSESMSFVDSERSLRSLALDMIIRCAKQPSPNLAQLLVGLNPVAASTASFGSSSASQLAVADRTPLETIVQLLSDPELALTHSQLAAQAYQLLFVLLQQSPTRSRTATLLRSRHQDFFYIQLFQVILQAPPSLHQSAERLEGLGWLLKAIALELHLTRGTGHRSYTQRILNVLFGLQTQSDNGGFGSSAAQDHPTSQLQLQFQYGQDVQQQRMKMREVVEAALLFLATEQPPNAAALRRSPLLHGVDITKATVLDSLQVPLVDVRELSLLIKETHQPGSRDTDTEPFSFGGSAPFMLPIGPFAQTNVQAGSSAIPQPEKQEAFQSQLADVLHQIVGMNKFQKTVGALCHAFEGWKEVLAVTLGECFHLLESSTRSSALYELQDVLLQNLNHLLRISADMGLESAMEAHLSRRLGVPMSQCIALLLAKLRQQLLTPQVSENRSTEPRVSEMMQVDGAPPPDQLVLLLHGLAGCLLQSDNYLSLRLNLYTALVHYLQLVLRLKDSIDPEEYRVVFSESTAILRHAGSRIIDIVASDACDASDGQKLIPLGLLTILLPYFDTDGSWLDHLSRHNYLHQFVDHILRQDDSLVNGDAPAMYVFESEMALLTAIASSPADLLAVAHDGVSSSHAAELLIENKIFSTLSRCSFMESRPEDRVQENGYERVPFRADVLLQSVLRLCQAVLIKLDQNEEAARQISNLFVEHSDAIVSVLKDPHYISLETLVSSSDGFDRLEAAVVALTTLSGVTGVLRSLARFPHILHATMSKRLALFDHLQLELLAKYTSIEERLGRLNRSSTASSVRLRPHITSVVHNILSYLRVRSSVLPPKTALVDEKDPITIPQLFALQGSSSKQPSVLMLVTLLQQTRSHLEAVHAKIGDVKAFQTKLAASRVDDLASQIERLRSSGYLDDADLFTQAAIVAPYHSQYRYQRDSGDHESLLLSLTAPQRLRLAKRLWSDQLIKLQEQGSTLSLNVELIIFLLWHNVAPLITSRPPTVSLSTKERDHILVDLSSRLVPQLDAFQSMSSVTPHVLSVSRRFRDLIERRNGSKKK